MPSRSRSKSTEPKRKASARSKSKEPAKAAAPKASPKKKVTESEVVSHGGITHEEYEDTLLDAALLAAQYSKGKKAGRVPVSLTRCRNVFKPKGFVAGMVRLTGTVGTVSVDVNRDKKRLERLEQIRNT